MQYSTCNTVHAIQYMQYSTCNTVHAIQYMQYSTCNTVHAIQYMQYSTCNTVHAIQYMQYSTCNTVHAQLWQVKSGKVMLHYIISTLTGVAPSTVEEPGLTPRGSQWLFLVSSIFFFFFFSTTQTYISTQLYSAVDCVNCLKVCDRICHFCSPPPPPQQHLYDPLDPDKDTLAHHRLTKNEQLDHEFWLLRQLGRVLEKANFRRLPHHVVCEEMREHDTDEGVRVSVNVNSYDTLQVSFRCAGEILSGLWCD